MAKKTASIPYNNPHLRRRAEQRLKKLNRVTLVLAVLALLVGLAIGAAAAWKITANDGLTLTGEKHITYTVGEGGGSVVLPEAGFTAVSLGRDVAGSVSVETALEAVPDGFRISTAEPGVYAIVYTSTDPLLRQVRQVRVVTVLADEGGEA